jgi:hypothetical protein
MQSSCDHRAVNHCTNITAYSDARVNQAKLTPVSGAWAFGVDGCCGRLGNGGCNKTIILILTSCKRLSGYVIWTGKEGYITYLSFV